MVRARDSFDTENIVAPPMLDLELFLLDSVYVQPARIIQNCHCHDLAQVTVHDDVMQYYWLAARLSRKLLVRCQHLTRKVNIFMEPLFIRLSPWKIRGHQYPWTHLKMTPKSQVK